MRKQNPFRKRIEHLEIGRAVHLDNTAKNYQLANNTTQRARIASGNLKSFSIARTAKKIIVFRICNRA